MKRILCHTVSISLIFIGLTYCSKPDPQADQKDYLIKDPLPKDSLIKDPLLTDPQLYDTTPAAISSVFFNPYLVYDSVKDIEGNVYKTIRIGIQTWMAENLKTTMYNDGSTIPYVVDDSRWVTLKIGAYRWYNDDRITYKNLYGALYNWYTVKTGKLCPTGWHVPSDNEWKQLEMELGMTPAEAESCGEWPGIDARGTDQGTKMKATSGWEPWEGIDGNGTNTSGFTALPAGESGWAGWYNGSESYLYTYYGGAGVGTNWWYSSEGGGRSLTCNDSGVYRGVYPVFCGFSVRCVKD